MKSECVCRSCHLREDFFLFADTAFTCCVCVGGWGVGLVDSANREVAVLCNHQKAAPKNFDEQLARADSAFSSMQRLTARLEAGGGALGRLIADSTLAIRAENAIAQLDSLLADMQRNPRRYVRLSIF